MRAARSDLKALAGILSTSIQSNPIQSKSNPIQSNSIQIQKSNVFLRSFCVMRRTFLLNMMMM
mgnify:CR=1 FL=1